MASRRGEQAARNKAKATTDGPRPAKIHDLFLARLDDLEKKIGSELERPAVAEGPVQQLVLDLGREVWGFGRDFFARLAQPGGLSAAVAAMGAAGPCDELGADSRLTDLVHDVVRPLARLWLGMDAREDLRLPPEGAALLLLNRSAWPVPGEAVVLAAYLAETAGKSRPVYVLWEREVFELPYLGDTLAKLGIFAATRENCRTLLERGALVVGFPEGSAANEKTYDSRYRLERFDAAGLISAAVETGAAVVPGAVVGSEESFPVLGHFAGVPITPTFPLLGVLGLLPLPLRWKLRFGSPVEYAQSLDDAPGRFQVDGLADAVRSRMQMTLGDLLMERGSIFRG
jgi:1-acyl-sn-glycerol-3-phosphate acyltransferase